LKKPGSNTIKLAIGLIISALFLYLAFRDVEFSKMMSAFKDANYWYFIPTLVVIFVSHWFRAWRWQFFIRKIKKIPVSTLFSATIIGYMANTVLPAHLGEVFRANVVGNRSEVPTSAIFATIVIERIADMLSLLLIMVLTLFVFPFPHWVIESSYVFFLLVVGIFTFLILLKVQYERTIRFARIFLGKLPETLAVKIEELIEAFVDGINGLKRKLDYIAILILSILIWALYALSFHLISHAFNLFELYQLSPISSLVLLVITTVAIIVPSSPGYVGTYHFLCKTSLAMFKVPGPLGLSYAIIMHALTTYGVAIVGVFFAWREGLSRLRTKKEISATNY
jgi:uncharacterized protein (TIRG00374 family)